MASTGWTDLAGWQSLPHRQLLVRQRGTLRTSLLAAVARVQVGAAR